VALSPVQHSALSKHWLKKNDNNSKNEHPVNRKIKIGNEKPLIAIMHLIIYLSDVIFLSLLDKCCPDEVFSIQFFPLGAEKSRDRRSLNHICGMQFPVVL